MLCHSSNYSVYHFQTPDNLSPIAHGFPTINSPFPSPSSAPISSTSKAIPETPMKTLSKCPNGTDEWRRIREYAPQPVPFTFTCVVDRACACGYGKDSKTRHIRKDAKTPSSYSRRSLSESTTSGPSTSAPHMEDTTTNGSSEAAATGEWDKRLHLEAEQGANPTVSSPPSAGFGPG